MSISGAAEKAFTPALRAKFIKLVERAETLASRGTEERLAKLADKKGEESLALIAKYHQLNIAPKPVSLVDQFPHFYKNETYVNDLIGAKTPLGGQRVLQELQKFTDAGSGIHTMAGHLEALGERLPGRDMFTAATKGFGYYKQPNIFEGGLALEPTDAVAKVAQAVGRLENLTHQEQKTALEFLEGRAGITDTARHHISNAKEQVSGLMPKLMKEPGGFSKLFGGKPSEDEAVVKSIQSAYSAGLTRIGEMAKPVTPAAQIDVPAVRNKLMADLLNVKMNKTEEWKVFSSETWAKFQEISTSRTSGSSSGSTVVETARSLFEKVESGSSHGSFGGTSVKNGEGKISKAVDLPIPNTDARAPMVTVQHILNNAKGDYIVVSGGKLHVVGGADVSGWFALAEKEARGGRLLGTR